MTTIGMVIAVIAGSTGAADLRATGLRCEYLEDPVGIDAVHPRLGWILESGTRGQGQTAYRILVASSDAKLDEDAGDLWDSGKVASSEQNQIEYAGRPLASDQECFWKVRVWDRDGLASAWSATARWRTALLRPEDWKARWIQPAGRTKPALRDCRWVWFPEGEPARSAPPGVRFFRKEFRIAEDARIERASMHLTADNRFRLFANGAEVGSGTAWEMIHEVDLTPHVRPGLNAIGIAATNDGPSPSPAGVIGVLVIALTGGAERTEGTEMRIRVDSSWKTSAEERDGWKAAGFDDGDWPAAKELGAFGSEPWKQPAAAAGPLPLFRKAFAIEKPVRRAVVHVCGLGHYELSLDGRKVGDRFLDPAWSVYEQTVYYATYDITARLGISPHAFGAMLGKGFYNTAGDRRVHGVNADRPLALILQAHITFDDGTEKIIASDGSWRTAPGPITHSAILGGEDYDARRLPAGWDRPVFDDSAWDRAIETEGPGGMLAATFAPPMRFHDVFSPVRIDEPAPGICVYDFGQNASAVPRLRIRGAAGRTVKLTPAEQRHGMTPRRNDGKGRVNPAGVGTPNYFRYTLRGGASEEWTPQFSYSGFQFLEVEGAVPAGRPNPDDLPVIESLVSIHVRNDAPAAGRFECSNPLFNRIDGIIDWAVRSNLSHVLTDCPHREKLGWLEVAYLMGPSIAGRYDIARFYGKVARDCADSRKPDGMVPTVAPSYPAFGGGFAYTPEWGAAAVVVPWQVYEWYGDRTVLAASYATMKGFVDYMRETSSDLVPRPGLGDWYDYGHGKPVGASQFTPTELSAMATFRRCALIVAGAARILGKPDEARVYADLAAEIARAFNARFFDGKSEYKNHGSPQAANSMALVTGMVPPDRESAVLARIVEDIRGRGNQQTAGDIAHWYLLQALGRHGRHDVIYDMTARTDMGSYGFIVENGWTSMPEAWDANTGASMNHCMLGHIQEWFFGDVGGIRPDPEAPGFRRFTIAPQPAGDLAWARDRYDSIRGPIESEWRRDGGRFLLRVTIPCNTTATVFLPAADAESIRESGRPLAQAEGVKRIRMETGAAVLSVEGGTYAFESRAPR
ncbi:MAG: family 78 glycoside hydrolase catalytic domain [Planctomycetes bacterium]|nr:family 78 glycoside hydrolase catalytic domain [Planctomycetota bacterium]